MDYTRQRDLLNQNKISNTPVTIIGCGALGSVAAMALAKMGVMNFELFDEDGVDEVNLPNQMYRNQDVGDFKVDALGAIIKSYNPDTRIWAHNKMYTNQLLSGVIIIATDSMSSRKLVWKEFIKQNSATAMIEARMGAEEGQIYIICKVSLISESGELNPNKLEVAIPDIEFYEERLYDDKDTIQLPCTGKAIIYNVFMVGSLIGRAFKAVAEQEQFPRELIFGMKQLHKYSFQVRQ